MPSRQKELPIILENCVVKPPTAFKMDLYKTIKLKRSDIDKDYEGDEVKEKEKHSFYAK